jgi:hypothetical protein
MGNVVVYPAMAFIVPIVNAALLIPGDVLPKEALTALETVTFVRSQVTEILKLAPFARAPVGIVLWSILKFRSDTETDEIWLMATRAEHCTVAVF